MLIVTRVVRSKNKGRERGGRNGQVKMVLLVSDRRSKAVNA